MLALEALFEAGVDPAETMLSLPENLARLYGGSLHLAPRTLFANFVQSIDGVVKIRGEPSAASMISGGAEADHFVMALLRACADAVLIGAGTLRDAPGHRWTPEGICPELASSFADLRRRLGLPPEPALAVVTAGAAIDPGHRALRAGALILTTSGGAARLGPVLPLTCEIEVLGDGQRLDVARIPPALRARGWQRILSEAGPEVTGQLLAHGLLDELFVTQSPVLSGGTGNEREGLAGGRVVPGGLDAPAGLRSLRRHGSHLFLRYRLSGLPRG